MNLLHIGGLVAGLSLAALVLYLIPALKELRLTLAAVRNLEPKIVGILDNSRRITSNVEEISRQVLTQSGRVDRITTEATEMVDNVKKTVDLYNRTIARPVIFVASMASGLKGITSVLFRKRRN